MRALFMSLLLLFNMPMSGVSHTTAAPPIDLTPDLTAYLEDVAEAIGISFDEARDREAWRQALLPLTLLLTTDRHNFAEGYRVTTDGRWRTVITYTGDLASAEALVAGLIPRGADVEFQHVERSSAWFDEQLRYGRADHLMSLYRDRVAAIGHSVERNALLVITQGPQPEVEAA